MLRRLPAVLRIDPNVLASSACSGHGIAMATMTGKIMADAVHHTSADFDLLANLPQRDFPGGAALRWPLLALAMTWYSMRDRLGI